MNHPASIWLTGKRRFRVNSNGELVLQIEVGKAGLVYSWRDATVEDLTVHAKAIK